LLSSLGSATGGLLLYVIFHHWGWAQLAAAYPDLLQSKRGPTRQYGFRPTGLGRCLPLLRRPNRKLRRSS
ncbi:MAG: hypothetical protein WBL86_08925, partial [Pseudolabrys sp.]